LQEKGYISLIENYICPRGYSHSIHDGRREGARRGPTEFHSVNPKKIHEAEIFSPKNCLHENFLPPKIQNYNTSLY